MYTPSRLLRPHWFQPASHDAILPPTGETDDVDSLRVMNPYVVIRDGQYWLYYAGAGPDHKHRICLATAPIDDPASFTRHGAVMDVGEAGAFDAQWNVLPHVVQVAPDAWHLYYTANSGEGKGLSAFPGLGLATSRDGLAFTRHPESPVLCRTERDGDPDAIGMAGGSVLRVGDEWWYYYTGCPTVGDDVFLDQQKTICLAVSQDGVTFQRRGCLMRRDPHHDYEDIAVAGPVVLREANDSYRMWYSAIGTRWGWYSICYAESEDGIHWNRGIEYGENLAMAPITGSTWCSQMVEYPAVIPEDGRMRLYHCGDVYGGTGIGMATTAPLRLASDHIVDHVGQTTELRVAGIPRDADDTGWTHIQHNGQQWREWAWGNDPSGVDRPIRVRLIIDTTADGLHGRLTVINHQDTPLTPGVTLQFHGAPRAIAWDAGLHDFTVAAHATATRTVTIA